jgi:hypothetical protein
MKFDYQPPLDEFLRRGEPILDERWIDARESTIGPENVADLIRMATDDELFYAAPGDDALFAPIYAWRALGQLRAVEAIEPLIDQLWRTEFEEGNVADSILPLVLGMIGPEAVPALADYLRDRGRFFEARGTTVRAIAEVVYRYPEARAVCIATLAAQLERFAWDDRLINSIVASCLIGMEALETQPLISRAAAADAFQPSMLAEDPDSPFGWSLPLGLPSFDDLVEAFPQLSPEDLAYALESVTDPIDIPGLTPPKRAEKPAKKPKSKAKRDRK